MKERLAYEYIGAIGLLALRNNITKWNLPTCGRDLYDLCVKLADNIEVVPNSLGMCGSDWEKMYKDLFVHCICVGLLDFCMEHKIGDYGNFGIYYCSVDVDVPELLYEAIKSSYGDSFGIGCRLFNFNKL